MVLWSWTLAIFSHSDEKKSVIEHLKIVLWAIFRYQNKYRFLSISKWCSEANLCPILDIQTKKLEHYFERSDKPTLFEMSNDLFFSSKHLKMASFNIWKCQNDELRLNFSYFQSSGPNSRSLDILKKYPDAKILPFLDVQMKKRVLEHLQSPYSALRLKSDHIQMSGQINSPRTSQNGVMRLNVDHF